MRTLGFKPTRVADKAYDAMALREQIAAMPARAVITPRVNRREPIRWSKTAHRHRNLVERFFCRMKHFRRIATRYEKLAERFASFMESSRYQAVEKFYRCEAA